MCRPRSVHPGDSFPALFLVLLLGVLFLTGCSAPMRSPLRESPAFSSSADLPPGYSLVEGEGRPDPFSHLDLWPQVAQSSVYPLVVRFQDGSQEGVAVELVRHLEVAWRAHQEQMGFRRPLAYAPDGSNRFTAFVWKDFGNTLALAGGRSNGTSWEAFETFLVVDPWGPGGGDLLRHTIAHEFHHAVTLGYDPWESAAFRVASATFAQDVVYDESNVYLRTLRDFQAHPAWALGYSDHFDSWYAYGACLYLFFLRERFFPSHPRFLAEIWEGNQQPRRTGPIYTPPESGHQDFTWVMALSALLPQGVSFNDTLIEFARWRYYTGDRADARHWSEAVLFPEDGQVTGRELDVDGAPELQSDMMVTGSEYFRLTRGRTGNARPSIDFEGDPAVHWVIQVVPDPSGRSDGVAITGTRLDFQDLLELTLIVTALPRNLYDPSVVTEETYRFRMTLGRR